MDWPRVQGMMSWIDWPRGDRALRGPRHRCWKRVPALEQVYWHGKGKERVSGWNMEVSEFPGRVRATYGPPVGLRALSDGTRSMIGEGLTFRTSRSLFLRLGLPTGCSGGGLLSSRSESFLRSRGWMYA